MSSYEDYKSYRRLSDQIENCMHTYRDLISATQPFYDTFDRMNQGETTLAFGQTDIEILLDTFRVAVIQYEKANQLAQIAMTKLGKGKVDNIYGFYKEEKI